MISEEDMETISQYKAAKDEDEKDDSSVLRDYTKLFLEKLKQLNGRPSCVIMNLGGKGSGKTTIEFIEDSILIASDLPNPCLVFWKAPPNFLDKVGFKCPRSWFGRIYSVKSLREINSLLGQYSHVIFNMDEATRDMNAKQATTVNSRRFEKAVTLFRQKNVFLIYNTQIGNVSKSLRQLTDIVIYKANTKRAILESDDSFAKEYLDKIINLFNPTRKKYCLFQSSWSELLDKDGKLVTEGYLVLDKDQYCPWFDEELSKGYSDADLDSEFGDEKDKNQLIFEIADKFMKEKPGTPLKMVTQPYIEGWLRVTDENLLYDVQQLIPKIYSVIRYKLGDKKILEIEELEKKQLEKEKKKTKGQKDSLDSDNDNDNDLDDDDDDLIEDPDDSHASIVGFETEKGNTFAKFASANMSYKILEELFHFEKATKISVDVVRSVLFHLIKDGYVSTQEQLATVCGLAKGTLNDILKKFRDLNFRREIGYLLEDWWVSTHGGSAAHNEHIPDWIDPNTGEIWSFKWRLDYSKQLKFYQNSDFKPEYDAARKKETNYKVGFLNSAWGVDMQVVEVNPFGDPDVNFRKE